MTLIMLRVPSDQQFSSRQSGSQADTSIPTALSYLLRCNLASTRADFGVMRHPWRSILRSCSTSRPLLAQT